ncbi:MAG: uroporphyrinogen-III C-methyltransferase [Gammaproteobacteria bacterium]|nr:uroporphyrinogen-III C-methyltransferase [Gammaproteobacteria bacterium]
MQHLPVFLDLRDQTCLIVGGGEVAARKCAMLRRAGAKVKIVAPALCRRLAEAIEPAAIEHVARDFQTADVEDVALVVAATDDGAVNEKVSQAARARRIPVNVVDHPELCSFVFPSIVDRSPVIVAVSSGGASPVLARLVRARLEGLLPAGLGRLAKLLGRYRDRIKQRIPTFSERRRFWEDLIQGPFSEHVLSGDEAAAVRLLEDRLAGNVSVTGAVYLIGAGPGDPDLLSFRALRLMQAADVVLYDRLVSPEVLDLVRRDAERIYVGKRRNYHRMRQEEINATLLNLAQAGKRVVRLKGGDPFVFGRGGEEIAGLAAAGIHFEVVPGVTAANGCAAYAGIPLTHRDYAQSVVLVTGNLRDGRVNLDWAGLVRPQQTLVIYMGLTGLDQICAGLQSAGMSSAMPVALIERGTLPDQRVIVSTLAELPARVAGETIQAPTLLIVGDVVRLHEQFAWQVTAGD